MSTRALLTACAAVTVLWALVGLPWPILAFLFLGAWLSGSAARGLWRRR